MFLVVLVCRGDGLTSIAYEEIKDSVYDDYTSSDITHEAEAVGIVERSAHQGSKGLAQA